METPMSGADSPKGTSPIRAVIADDFPHMQAALVSCVESMPGVQVVATALNGREALDRVHELKPALAVVDLQMPVMDGFKLLRELRREYPQMRLIAVSGHQSPTVVEEALSAGANAFVSKNDLPFGLLKTLEEILAA
jgi:DNA-binding NarL/FixJ family response regulator